MDPLELIQKKLREADFFLRGLRSAAPTGDEADFNLSAFLSAAKAAAGKLGGLRPGFEDFVKARSLRERQLWKLMTSERAWDAHRVTPDTKRVEQGRQLVNAGGAGLVTAGGIPVVTSPCLCFLWLGDNVPAVELCGEILATLRTLIADYCTQEGLA